VCEQGPGGSRANIAPRRWQSYSGIPGVSLPLPAAPTGGKSCLGHLFHVFVGCSRILRGRRGDASDTHVHLVETGPALGADEGCRVLGVLLAERLDLEGDQAGVQRLCVSILARQESRSKRGGRECFKQRQGRVCICTGEKLRFVDRGLLKRTRAS